MDNTENNINELAWNQEIYDAWIQRFGDPEDAANRIRKDPAAKLHPIYQYFGDVKGKNIVNMMGSNGIKAVALALMGADVSVVDFSPANARYAEELSHAAGVNVNYIISNVLKLSDEELSKNYDIAFAELGILHYFTDLKPFIDVAYRLVKNGGRFVIRDFHPVSTKLISSKGTTHNVRKHKVNGDYFDTSLEEKDVSYIKYLPEGKTVESGKVYWRKWTIGEIVTAVADAGFTIKVLSEEPNLSSEVFDKGIPKTFTLVADKL